MAISLPLKGYASDSLLSVKQLIFRPINVFNAFLGMKLLMRAVKRMVLPPNCQRVSPNNHNICTLCASGYFINNNGFCIKAVQRNVPNCRRYELVTLKCQECENGYELVQ